MTSAVSSTSFLPQPQALDRQLPTSQAAWSRIVEQLTSWQQILTQLLNGQVAAAWCVFDGTVTGTHAPKNGFNVSTVTRNSAGNWTVTLAAPMPSANSCPVAAVNSTTSGLAVGTATSSTSAVTVTAAVSGTGTDYSEVKCVVFCK